MTLFISLVIGVGILYVIMRCRQDMKRVDTPAPPLPYKFYMSRMWLALVLFGGPFFYLMLRGALLDPADWAGIAFMLLLNGLCFVLAIRVLFFPAFVVTEVGIKPMFLPWIKWQEIEKFEEVYCAKYSWDLGVILKEPKHYWAQLRWGQKLRLLQWRFVSFQNFLLGDSLQRDVIRLPLYTRGIPPNVLMVWMQEYQRLYGLRTA